MDGFILIQNHQLKCWRCFSLLNWIVVLTIASIAKVASDKIRAMIRSIKFFLEIFWPYME